jgi:hypothetical protein
MPIMTKCWVVKIRRKKVMPKKSSKNNRKPNDLFELIVRKLSHFISVILKIQMEFCKIK